MLSVINFYGFYILHSNHSMIPFILDTSKKAVWQTVETKMKNHMECISMGYSLFACADLGFLPGGGIAEISPNDIKKL